MKKIIILLLIFACQSTFASLLNSKTNKQITLNDGSVVTVEYNDVEDENSKNDSDFDLIDNYSIGIDVEPNHELLTKAILSKYNGNIRLAFTFKFTKREMGVLRNNNNIYQPTVCPDSRGGEIIDVAYDSAGVATVTAQLKKYGLSEVTGYIIL